MPFVKLDANITTSTLWCEDHETLRVWIYLLATASPQGTVRVTVPALAAHCFIAAERAREILGRFAAPDPDSRTSANEGRRIEIVHDPQFEIRLLNYAAYRNKDHTAAARSRRYRERHPTAVTRDGRDDTRRVTQAEAEAEAEAQKRRKTRGRFTPPTLQELTVLCRQKGYTFSPEAFLAHYTSNGWMVGRNCMKDWQAACVGWQTREGMVAGPRVAMCTRCLTRPAVPGSVTQHCAECDEEIAAEERRAAETGAEAVGLGLVVGGRR